jgi:phytol kinase
MNATLVVPQWTACAAAFGAFLLLLVGLDAYARGSGAPAEVTRKLLHSGSGALTLTFPFLFRDLWPVLLLTGTSAGLLAAVRFVAPLRARLGAVANRVARPTLGELYFPLAVAVIFCFTRNEPPLLFVIPILILTLADSICAIVGGRYGTIRLPRSRKTLEGSAAFAVVAFLCVHAPLLLWSDVGRAQTLLIAAAVALFATTLEAAASRGLDNLIVPIGSYALLRALSGLI